MIYCIVYQYVDQLLSPQSWRRTWTTPTPWGPVLTYEHWSTWFPPLFGFTNTSRGFMSWEGRGFTRNGFQRPSCSWETQQRLRRTTEVLMEMKLSASWPPIQSRKEHSQLHSKYKQIHMSKIINMMQTSLECKQVNTIKQCPTYHTSIIKYNINYDQSNLWHKKITADKKLFTVSPEARLGFYFLFLAATKSEIFTVIDYLLLNTTK